MKLIPDDHRISIKGIEEGKHLFDQLDRELQKTKEQLRMKRKWKEQLVSYQSDLEEQEQICREYSNQLLDEKVDVEKLTNLSMTNFFATITGKKEERLLKEKEEVAAAVLKYDESKEAVKDIQKEIENLQSKLVNVNHVEDEYKEILKEKEQLILAEDSPITEELYEITETKADLEALKTELNEAIRAGQSVHASLEEASHSLQKAEGWGTFDLFGGGAISTAVKHNHIDDAKQYIHQAQTQMRLFQKELKDVEGESEWNVDISGILTFADFFFDGLIADWMVQGKIKDSLEQVRKQEKEVQSLLYSLRDTYKRTEQDLEASINRRKRLVEQS